MPNQCRCGKWGTGHWLRHCNSTNLFALTLLLILSTLFSIVRQSTERKFTEKEWKVIEYHCKGNKLAMPKCTKFSAGLTIKQLALLAETDDTKWEPYVMPSRYHYYDVYESWISKKMRSLAFTVIELGVLDGNSLRLWQKVFPRAHVVGVDLYTKWPAIQPQSPVTYEVIRGDIRSNKTLQHICNRFRDIRMIVDDASHEPDSTVRTFEQLFPCLSSGGLYVIEDTISFYDPELNKWPVGSENVCQKQNAMLNFKALADAIGLAAYQYSAHNNLSLAEKSAFSVHFYTNMVIVQKKYAELTKEEQLMLPISKCHWK